MILLAGVQNLHLLSNRNIKLIFNTKIPGGYAHSAKQTEKVKGIESVSQTQIF